MDRRTCRTSLIFPALFSAPMGFPLRSHLAQKGRLHTIRHGRFQADSLILQKNQKPSSFFLISVLVQVQAQHGFESTVQRACLPLNGCMRQVIRGTVGYPSRRFECWLLYFLDFFSFLAFFSFFLAFFSAFALAAASSASSLSLSLLSSSFVFLFGLSSAAASSAFLSLHG